MKSLNILSRLVRYIILGSHAWGQIGSVAGDFTLDDAGDQIIDLIQAPKSQFRGNGRFAMNRRTVAAVRKLKDADGRYLWRCGVRRCDL